MLYKNISDCTKTFYGIEFRPSELHEVPGYINDNAFIIVDKPVKDTNDKKSKPASSKQTKPKKLNKGDLINGTDSDK